ncbi:hypothetical protein Sps_02171 [Shewanella psychrophila]|uniref:Lipid A deacylase LpxR family protein n=1 Tax=Shewanella psychrophila TaxID=225848 RepID=A0A1S6HPA2_9GAMM|nr:lipid A deacylase LpxR family protein [Shewanella psychrophila]AQS37329.1 hypothetical protein Sps_02171 [Shewanella psychrophila]
MLKYIIAISLTLPFFILTDANAADVLSPSSSWGQFTFENDAFGVLEPSDDGYTNGVAYSWGEAQVNSFEDVNIPAWLHYISDWTYINRGEDGSYTVSYSIQQGMYTPTNLEEESLIVDDRPYAGVLIWQAKLRQFDKNVATSLIIDVGVVGPAALAEPTQTAIHSVISATMANGWDNQINNEPVFRVGSEYVKRLADFPLSDSIVSDLNFYAQAGIGNLRSDVSMALIFRLGSGLDETFSLVSPTASHSANPYTLVSGHGFYWQVFMSLHGRYVLNDITLNGNTFEDSHSVDLIHEQNQFSLGFAMRWESWGVLFSTLRGSKQFDDQQDDTNFAAVSISYFY